MLRNFHPFPKENACKIAVMPECVLMKRVITFNCGVKFPRHLERIQIFITSPPGQVLCTSGFAVIYFSLNVLLLRNFILHEKPFKSDTTWNFRKMTLNWKIPNARCRITNTLIMFPVNPHHPASNFDPSIVYRGVCH